MQTATPRIDVAAGDAANPLPIVLGFPFPVGQLREVQALSLRDPQGQLRPCFARPLQRWPDGSIRWALLSFTAANTGLHDLLLDAPSPALDAGVQLREESGGLTLDNGLLRCRLTRQGPGPIAQLQHQGRDLLRDAGDLQFLVDDATSLHHGSQPRTLTVLEQNPLRVLVRVEGAHHDARGQRRLHYKLDVELWARSAALRLDYQFLHLEPGFATLPIQRIALRYRPAVGAAPRRHLLQRCHGPLGQPRVLLLQKSVEILGDAASHQPHARTLADLDDPGNAPPYMLSRGLTTSDWLGLFGDQGAAYLRMADFTALYPKRLASDGDALELDLWPGEAGTLHLPQGRCRRATMTLAFAGAEAPPPAAIAALLQGPCHEGRACIDPPWARHCGSFGVHHTLAPGQIVRFEKYLRRLIDGLKLQRGMFDLGDGVESGYTENYAAAGILPRRDGQSRNAMQVQPTPLTELEPVFANNEYDVIHTLAIEMLRTGRRGLWPTLHQLVRHNIEVDFVHYSDDPWQHHGSPAHSACHNQASSYPSHIWTQGLLEYHALSGDPDALDAAIKLGDTILRNLHDIERGKHLWGFNREVGWPVLALSCLAQATGEARFLQELGKIVDFLMAFDRRRPAKAINLSGVDPRDDFHRQMIAGFFGYAAMVEGIDLYAQLSGRDDVHRWLLALLLDLRQALAAMHREGRPLTARHMHLLAMAIGYERSGDIDFLRWGMVSLREMLDEELWHAPPTEVKAVAMVHRGLVRFLGHAQRAGLLPSLDYTLPS